MEIMNIICSCGTNWLIENKKKPLSWPEDQELIGALQKILQNHIDKGHTVQREEKKILKKRYWIDKFGFEHSKTVK